MPHHQLCSRQENFGQDLPAVEAAKKKHEAIETDTAAYKERVQAIEAVAKELEAEGYHDIKRIKGRKDNILRLWEQLQELLRARRQRLEMNLTLQHLFQEMLHSIDWMDEVKVSGCRRMCPSPGACIAQAMTEPAAWCQVLTTCSEPAGDARIFRRHSWHRLNLGSTSWRWRSCWRPTGCWKVTWPCRWRRCGLSVLLPSASPTLRVGVLLQGARGAPGVGCSRGSPRGWGHSRGWGLQGFPKIGHSKGRVAPRVGCFRGLWGPRGTPAVGDLQRSPRMGLLQG